MKLLIFSEKRDRLDNLIVQFNVPLLIMNDFLQEKEGYVSRNNKPEGEFCEHSWASNRLMQSA